jgi:hypothetical protein
MPAAPGSTQRDRASRWVPLCTSGSPPRREARLGWRAKCLLFLPVAIYFRIAPKADANSISACIAINDRLVPGADSCGAAKTMLLDHYMAILIFLHQ